MQLPQLQIEHRPQTRQFIRVAQGIGGDNLIEGGCVHAVSLGAVAVLAVALIGAARLRGLIVIAGTFGHFTGGILPGIVFSALGISFGLCRFRLAACGLPRLAFRLLLGVFFVLAVLAAGILLRGLAVLLILIGRL